MIFVTIISCISNNIETCNPLRFEIKISRNGDNELTMRKCVESKMMKSVLG